MTYYLHLLEHSHDFIRDTNIRRNEKQRREDSINKKKKKKHIAHILVFILKRLNIYIYIFVYICVYYREEHDKINIYCISLLSFTLSNINIFNNC